MLPRLDERIGQRGVHDDMPRRGDADAVRERLADQVGVDERDDRAHAGNPEPDRQIFRPIGHQQADHVAFADALRQRPARIAPYLLRQGPEREAFALRQQRDRIAEARLELIDDDGQNPPGPLGDRFGQRQRAQPRRDRCFPVRLRARDDVVDTHVRSLKRFLIIYWPHTLWSWPGLSRPSRLGTHCAHLSEMRGSPARSRASFDALCPRMTTERIPLAGRRIVCITTQHSP